MIDNIFTYMLLYPCMKGINWFGYILFSHYPKCLIIIIKQLFVMITGQLEFSLITWLVSNYQLNKNVCNSLNLNLKKMHGR